VSLFILANLRRRCAVAGSLGYAGQADCGGVVSVVKDRGRSALVAHQFFVVKWLRSVLAVGALVDRLLHRTAIVIVLFRNGLRRRRVRRITLTTMQKGGMP